MLKESKVLKLALIISFALIESTLLSLIVFVKVKNVDYYCFLAVIIAFVYSLVFMFSTAKNIKILGISSTLLADLFLILLTDINDYQIYGVIFFVIAQAIYAYYLFNNDPNHYKLSLLIRLIVNIIMVTILIVVLKSRVDFLSVISIIYFANLLTNIILCFFNFKSNYLFCIGLIMLVLCDLHVGLVNANGIYLFYNPDGIIFKIIYANFNYTWFFYILSLSFISLSIALDKRAIK